MISVLCEASSDAGWGEWLLNLALLTILLCSCSSPLPVSAPTHTAAPGETNSVSQEVEVVTEYVYYQITGSSEDELDAQMNQLGPSDESGHRWDAYTEWYVTWSYSYSTTENDCSTGPAKVQVEITFTFPQWDPPPNAPQDLVDRWDAYVAALQLHEDGHEEIAIEAGNEILQAISALPTYPLCSELEQAADRVGENILEEYRQQEAIYDQRTNHGVAQGARFP